MNCFVSKVNREAEEIKKTWNITPSFGNVRVKSWSMDNPTHSYEYLKQSFQKNWNNHQERIKAYNGNKENGIFLIQYSDAALAMCENVYRNWISGMSQGDMREQEEFHCYRLSRDKELLKFIYQSRTLIKYVIFVYNEKIEIIKLENIPYLLDLLPWDYVIYPLVVKHVSNLYNISFPK